MISRPAEPAAGSRGARGAAAGLLTPALSTASGAKGARRAAGGHWPAPARLPGCPALSLRAARIFTPAGVFVAWFSARGLARLELPPLGRATRILSPPLAGERETVWGRGSWKVEPASAPAPKPCWVKLTVRALADALAGRAPRRLPPLDLAAGTQFQRRVWAALRQIAPGRTRTYAQVAARIGRPQAVRAVGRACGANPIPVLIPCHRVVRADGSLGGFSSGLAWKRRLLACEQRSG